MHIQFRFGRLLHGRFLRREQLPCLSTEQTNALVLRWHVLRQRLSSGLHDEGLEHDEVDNGDAQHDQVRRRCPEVALSKRLIVTRSVAAYKEEQQRRDHNTESTEQLSEGERGVANGRGEELARADTVGRV